MYPLRFLRSHRWYISILPFVMLLLLSIGQTACAEKVALKVLIATSANKPFSEACHQIITNFEESHPEIDIQFDETDSREYDKITISFGTRDTWDVIEAHQGVILPWSEQGVLLPLDRYIENSADRFEDMPTPLLDLYKYKGHHWAVPYRNAPLIMLYNRNILSEAGLGSPDKNWTLADWYNMGLKITSPENNRWGYAHLNHDTFLIVATQMDARLYDVTTDSVTADSPEFVRALEFTFVDLPRITGSDAFEQGTIATLRTDIGHYNELINKGIFETTDIGVTLWPGDVRQRTFNGAAGFFIPKDAKHPDEAFEFIEFFTLRRESQRLIVASHIPVTFTGIEEFFVQQVSPEIAQIVLEASTISQPWSEMYNMEIDCYRQNDLITTAQKAITEGRWSPKVAATQIASMMRGLLSELRQD